VHQWGPKNIEDPKSPGMDTVPGGHHGGRKIGHNKEANPRGAPAGPDVNPAPVFGGRFRSEAGRSFQNTIIWFADASTRSVIRFPGRHESWSGRRAFFQMPPPGVAPQFTAANGGLFSRGDTERKGPPGTMKFWPQHKRGKGQPGG